MRPLKMCFHFQKQKQNLRRESELAAFRDLVTGHPEAQPHMNTQVQKTRTRVQMTWTQVVNNFCV